MDQASQAKFGVEYQQTKMDPVSLQLDRLAQME
jgi:hypothetical protein